MDIRLEHKQRRLRLGITPPRPVNWRPAPTSRVVMYLPREYDHHVRMWHYRNNPQDFTIPKICQMVQYALGTNIPIDELRFGKSRKQEVVHVRQKIWFEIKKRRPDMSYPGIGKYFEKDHTSVMAGIRRQQEQGWTGI